MMMFGLNLMVDCKRPRDGSVSGTTMDSKPQILQASVPHWDSSLLSLAVSSRGECEDAFASTGPARPVPSWLKPRSSSHDNQN